MTAPVAGRYQINAFTGSYRFLSNFYPCIVRFDGYAYASAEHAYQAAKTTSEWERARIRSCGTAANAKARGRTLAIRADWDTIKHDVMLTIVREKFLYEPLRDQLYSTIPHELVEGNYWHDNYWGICTCPRCGGSGWNRLGKILMQVRSEIAAPTRF